MFLDFYTVLLQSMSLGWLINTYFDSVCFLRAAASSELQLLLFDPAELRLVNYWAVTKLLDVQLLFKFFFEKGYINFLKRDKLLMKNL